VVSRRIISPEESDVEKGLLRTAIEYARRNIMDLRQKVRQTLDEAHASIFDPQLMVLDDPVIIERTMGRIEKFHENAAMAFMTVIQQFVDQFALLGDAYIASRNADVLDVGNRVCQYLATSHIQSHNLSFDEDVIILAPDLSPSDTAQMDHQHVKGFATELGGPTSHTAILAKALEIPAVVGLGPFFSEVRSGMMAIIDGYEGTVTIDPAAREITRARARRRRHLIHERDLQKLKHLPAETLDGYRVELSANVELPIEIPHVLAHGAEGVGPKTTSFTSTKRSSRTSPPTRSSSAQWTWAGTSSSVSRRPAASLTPTWACGRSGSAWLTPRSSACSFGPSCAPRPTARPRSCSR
jgi:phosphotransferase system enzyme I (PtsI)